jgi:hypothetical protein
MQDREVDHSVCKIDQTQARPFIDALGLGGKAVFGPPGSRKGKAQHFLERLDQPTMQSAANTKMLSAGYFT